MKKEILPQYVYRDKMGNSAALKEYYSLKFDKIAVMSIFGKTFYFKKQFYFVIELFL